jgi:hypothetical protein
MFQVSQENTENDRLVNAEKSIEELRVYIDNITSHVNNPMSKTQNSDLFKALEAELKNLNKRFTEQNENDKRIENLKLLLNTQSGVCKKQEEQFQEFRKEFDELKLNKYKQEFAKLYENFEKKVQNLYSIDDDPLFCLNEVIASIKDLKTCIIEYETFITSLCKIDEKFIESLEKQLNEFEKEPNKNQMITNSLKLTIEGKKRELEKVKEISITKGKISNFEKLFCQLKSELV